MVLWGTQVKEKPLMKPAPVSCESGLSGAVPCSSLGVGCRGLYEAVGFW